MGNNATESQFIICMLSCGHGKQWHCLGWEIFDESVWLTLALVLFSEIIAHHYFFLIASGSSLWRELPCALFCSRGEYWGGSLFWSPLYPGICRGPEGYFRRWPEPFTDLPFHLSQLYILGSSFCKTPWQELILMILVLFYLKMMKRSTQTG